MRYFKLAASLVTALALVACEARQSAPHADLRSDGGRITIGGGPPPDATNPDAASQGDASSVDANQRDAASSDAALDAAALYQCSAVPPQDASNRLSGSEVGSGTPIAFDTSYAFAQWDRVCSPPRLLIGLAEQSCTLDIGSQLVLALSEEALGTSLMVGGNQIEVAQFEDRIAVWFRYPTADATYRWGNCQESFGSLLVEDIGPRTGDRIIASFDLTLTDCDAPQQLAPIKVTGNIDVTVPDYARDCL